ncbi:hypothetical protein KEM54_000020 [Ascosphaera aggregata]|nr:hypothetical protein KEM54_000020 [Ascosphaera aggregata]
MHDPSEPQVCIVDDTNRSEPYLSSGYQRAPSVGMQEAPFGRSRTSGSASRGYTYLNNLWTSRNDGRPRHRYLRAHNRPRRRARQQKIRGVPMVLLIVLIVGLSVTTLMSMAGLIVLKAQLREKRARERLVYNPAKEAEKWTAVRFDGDVQGTNLFKVREGESDERWREVDRAWNGLYDVEPFAVSGKQLQIMNQSSMEIPSRPGQHLVKLAVFHQLHCLDMIRKYIHGSHYNFDERHATVPLIDHVGMYPSPSLVPMYYHHQFKTDREPPLSSDHCVDILRQAITCHADTALITFSFHPERPELVNPNFSVMHECRDFEAIRRWEKEREVKLENEIKNHLDTFLEAFATHNRPPGTAANMQMG